MQILKDANLSLKRRSELLAKSVAALEEMLGNPEIDPFARIAAAKCLIRDVIGAQPSKQAVQLNGSQAPVVINIGELPPSPSRPARDVTPSAGVSQPRVTIDGLPSPD